MSKKDEALNLALEAMERYQVKRQDFDRFADEITALREALAEQPAPCEPANDGVCEALDCSNHKPALTKVLNNPEDFCPGNFDTPERANAFLMGLCQEAATEIDRLKKDVPETNFGNMAAQQEPEIVQRVKRYAGQTLRTARNPNITARECIELANWIAAAPQLVQQEPVAVVSGYYGGQCVILPIDPARIFNSNTALYTSPPAQRTWVGLSDEEIEARAINFYNPEMYKRAVLWAQEKLKERNQ